MGVHVLAQTLAKKVRCIFVDLATKEAMSQHHYLLGTRFAFESDVEGALVHSGLQYAQ